MRQQSPHDAVDPPAQQSRQTNISTRSEDTASVAKRYARIKLRLSLLGTALFFVLTICVLASDATRILEETARRFFDNDYGVLLVFTAALGVAEVILTLPLQYYSGFYLEHKYNLSNQTLSAWMWEGLKGSLVSIPIVVPLIAVLYYCVRTFGSLWWLPVGSLLFLVSVVLARLAPVLILPLFYKFKPLKDGELKTRILTLCHNVGMPVQGVFVFDMSKNTKKANAAFTGIGKSKRIILGDTLVANFRDEEIESVFAHELGHYKLRHIAVMMALGTVSSFFGLYLTALVYAHSLTWFGFVSLDQIAALPLLALWLGVYSLVANPITNMISRAHEYAADRFAVRLTGNAEALGNSLKKLASINLADVSPHPWVEFLFHSHPSIEKRIRAIDLAAIRTASGAQR
ncbi:MAG: M48 family metallopeptidase [Ignavibacteriales bacterium]|nr:M48 family metallopeptidase [Ignavibacteriales bacterium]